MNSRDARILILCKTYPSPSSKYAETSCVAGMDEGGSLIRLYPVPFRMITDKKQFRKWQWITAKVRKSSDDHRAESHRLFVDTIKLEGEPLSTANNWGARREWLDKLTVYSDFNELELARQREGVTLGLLRPSRPLSLDVTPAESPEWTSEELAKLVQLQQQGSLFDETDATSVTTLKKLPFDFHYRYHCVVNGLPIGYRHKIVDWEAGALFWNLRRHHADRWRDPFMSKLQGDLPGKDLMFLMGTIHRFPEQWLIVSLIYPPTQLPEPNRQTALAL